MLFQQLVTTTFYEALAAKALMSARIFPATRGPRRRRPADCSFLHHHEATSLSPACRYRPRQAPCIVVMTSAGKIGMKYALALRRAISHDARCPLPNRLAADRALACRCGLAIDVDAAAPWEAIEIGVSTSNGLAGGMP